jgi:HK97 family phage prohead protease
MTLTTTRRLVRGGDREGRIFTASFHVAEVDTDRGAGYTELQGRACPYESWTTRWFFRESFAPGLFDKSIKEAARALPLLLFHDAAQWPIGHATEWESKPDGLWGTWRLDSSAEAQRAARMAADGHLPYLSVGYDPVLSEWELTPKDEWNLDDATTLDRCTRIEARLVETSQVSTPAFAEAEVTLVRSGGGVRPGRPAAPKLAQWQTWRRSLG